MNWVLDVRDFRISSNKILLGKGRQGARHLADDDVFLCRKGNLRKSKWEREIS